MTTVYTYVCKLNSKAVIIHKNCGNQQMLYSPLTASCTAVNKAISSASTDSHSIESLLCRYICQVSGILSARLSPPVTAVSTAVKKVISSARAFHSIESLLHRCQISDIFSTAIHYAGSLLKICQISDILIHTAIYSLLTVC